MIRARRVTAACSCCIMCCVRYKELAAAASKWSPPFSIASIADFPLTPPIEQHAGSTSAAAAIHWSATAVDSSALAVDADSEQTRPHPIAKQAANAAATQAQARNKCKSTELLGLRSTRSGTVASVALALSSRGQTRLNSRVAQFAFEWPSGSRSLQGGGALHLFQLEA